MTPNPETLTPLQKAALVIQELQARLQAAESRGREPIAVVGLGCRFPGGATDPDAYWRLLSTGGDGIVEVPADRWDIDAYYHPDPARPGSITTRCGGFLDRIDEFDAAFFGISPREAASMDPQQRLLLEVAWEALEHAAINPRTLAGSPAGVFIGFGQNDYAVLRLGSGDSDLSPYDGTGNGHSFAAGRLSYFFGARGPCLSIDTSCSSSLVAIHLACTSLRNRECDMALAGGVHLMLSPASSIFLSRMSALAPDGRAKTFDAAADGFSRGEGCGVVVFKRLSDALAAGDRVLAVVRGSAVNHDGASSGLTVPNPAAQQEVIREALRQSGLPAAEIGYVEAHGTATSLGDPIELEALAGVFADRAGRDPLWVGSVKTNFGHLEAAAGVASFIKVVLLLQNGVIPRHLHFRDPNPHVRWDRLPLRVAADPVPWTGSGRSAGVSSFGMCGTNAHVIVQAAEASSALPDLPEPRQHLLAISAKTDPALRELAHRYAGRLTQASPAELASLCYTARVGRARFSKRLAAVGRTPAEIRAALLQPAPASELPEPVRLWLEGQEPDWKAFPPGRRISAPTYPWQRKRFWLENQNHLAPPQTDLPDLYEIVWRNVPAPGKQPLSGTWLVSGSPALSEAMLRAGSDVTDHPAPGLSGAVCVLSGLDWEAACETALCLVQQLAERFPSKLYLVTKGAQPVDGPSAWIEPGQSAIFGLGRTIQQEHPDLGCTLIDLDPTAEDTVETLLTELSNPSAEPAVAWREGRRYVSRLAKMPPPDPAGPVEFDSAPGRSVLVLGPARPHVLEAVDRGRRAGSEVLFPAGPADAKAARLAGASHVLPPESFEEEVLRLTAGCGVDLVLNFHSGSEAAAAGFQVLRENGTFIDASRKPGWSVDEVARRRPDALYRTVASDRSAHCRIASGGTYVISGGLGALGYATAEWLIGRGARDLVLLTRRAASPEDVERVRKLRQRAGRVELRRLDVGNAAAVNALFQELQRDSRTVRGIVHAAGEILDGVLVRQDWQQFRQTMLGKVRGAWNLHLASRDCPLDFFVSYSSLAGLFGSAGQAPYAAANAFLDGLAQMRRGMGLPALSVNWSAWTGGGMAAGIPQAFRKRLDSLGIEAISPGDALRVLGRLLPTGIAQAAPMRVDWRRFSAATHGEMLLISELAGTSVAPPSAAPPSPPAAHSPVEQLRQLAASVLQLSTAELDFDQPLSAAGLDSLMALELRNEIQHKLGQQLPLDKLLEGPSIAQLAAEIFPKAPSGNGAARAAVTGEFRRIMIPLQQHGSGAPLIFAYPWMGIVYPYAALATALGKDRPVYGLQAAGLFTEPDKTIDAMAKRCADAIVATCPTGPVAIGGWSFGAPLAFEIACELTRRGREVTRAVLLDPPKTHASIADWLRFLLTISATHIWPYVIDHLVLSARSAVAAGAAASGDFDLRRPGIFPLGRALAHELRALLHKDSLTRRLFRTTNANSRAFQRYQPSIYAGRLTIVRLKQHVRPGETDPSIGWAALARDGASVEFLQGHHLRFLREEHVGGVASWLRTTLAAAETEKAAATREAG